MQRFQTLVMPERKISLGQYKKKKIKMLSEDFGITLTEKDIEAINNGNDEYSIDCYARKLLNKKLN